MSTSVSPAITYAIPFYSGAAYLSRSLDSLLRQRDPAWRAIVVDDGSEPGIAERVRSYGERIAYVKNPSNIGMGNNFNRCLELADTELVVVFHADDELEPDYTATMRAAAARHPEAAAVFCRCNIIGPDHQPRFSLPDAVKDYLVHPSPRREIALTGERGIRALLKANFIPAPTLCFRRRLLGDRRFEPAYKFVLDWEFTTRLLFEGETLIGIPDRVYRYRRHDEAATSKYTRNHLRFREESAFYDRMLAEVTRRGWTACTKLARKRQMTKLNVAYLTLRNVAHLQLGEARRNFNLLREL